MILPGADYYWVYKTLLPEWAIHLEPYFGKWGTSAADRADRFSPGLFWVPSALQSASLFLPPPQALVGSWSQELRSRSCRELPSVQVTRGRGHSPALETTPLQPLTPEPIGRIVSGVIDSSGGESLSCEDKGSWEMRAERQRHTKKERHTERQREKAKTQHSLCLLVTTTKNV